MTSPAVNCAHDALVPVADLKGNPDNPNKHDIAQLNLYAKILLHQGWRKSLTVSNQSGFIVTGHGAWLTAKAQGWPAVPVDYQDFASKSDEVAHMIADNKLAQMAELDDVELAKLIRTELDGKCDLDLTGLDLEGLRDIGAVEPEPIVDAPVQIDRAEELRIKWGVERGQLWELGEHRLLCGDCLQESDLARLIGEEIPAMVFSDAPYGISIVNESGHVSTGLPVGPALRGKIGGDKPFGKVGGIHKGMISKPIIASNLYPPIIGDDDGKTAREAFRALSGKFPKAVHIWWGANHFSDVFPPSSCWIVWDKDNGDSFFADAELAYCSAKTAVRIFKHTWNGLIKESERGQRRCHPTQKPIALAVWCIQNYSGDGCVLEPFSGSGTTLLACEQLGRRCRAIEIDPGYVAVALERWAVATGKTPRLLG